MTGNNEYNGNNSPQDVALLIDHDNINISFRKDYNEQYDIRVFLKQANMEGNLALSKIYFNFETRDKFVFTLYNKYGIIPVYSPAIPGVSGNKSLTDPIMFCDIMETLYERPNINIFIIGSGDKDFIPVIKKIKEHGKKAIIIAIAGSTADQLKRECSHFYDYEILYNEYTRDLNG